MWFSKQKKIKEKGVALCSVLQGFSANNRAISIIEKTKEIEQTEEILKQLYQVSVDLSMEEFLRRFFNMYWDDAELLCKLLGFETEFEADMAEDAMKPEEMDSEDEWQQKHIAYLDEKLSAISLLNKAKDVEEYSKFDIADKFEIFAVQKAFEEGVKEFGIEFTEEESETISKSEKVVEVEEKNSVNESEENTSEVVKSKSSDNVNTNNKEEEILDIQEILKSSEAQDLLKAMLQEQLAPVQEELNKTKADLEAVTAEKADLEKAKEANEKAQFEQVIKGFSFIGSDEEVAEAVEALFKSEARDVVVKIFEKASVALAAGLTQEIGQDHQEHQETDINKAAELDGAIEDYNKSQKNNF
jgi:hypothetical protein